MTSLLARYAECAYWMARYLERAENIARILDVNETFARNQTGASEWLPVVQLFADEARFARHYPRATAFTVVSFYILDADNPTSILNDVHKARENARALRHLISSEVWRHVNVFYNRLRSLGPEELTAGNISHLCRSIKEDCQLHTGMAEGTLYRDESWYFMEIGRAIERADQTTRLIDIKVQHAMPEAGDAHSPMDLSQWNALLRSAAAYHAYRRLHPRTMTPARVVDFLLFDPAFPRSVRANVEYVLRLLDALVALPGHAGEQPAPEAAAALRQRLAEDNARTVFETGVHAYLDSMQRDLVAVSSALRDQFFGR